MNILIISNGDLGDIEFLRRSIPPYDYVICADGGIRFLRPLGLIPHLIIGDFDSTPPEPIEQYRLKGVPILRYPIEKDRTDTHIAIDIAIEKGAKNVYMVGALGNRWDHSYANVMLLCRLKKHGINGKILHSNSVISVSNDRIELEGNVGDIVSLLPLGQDTVVGLTKGLKYRISDERLPLDNPYGVSNVFAEKKAVILIKSGWVAAVQAAD